MGDTPPRRILVIEDHAVLLELIATNLAHAGYVVMTATSAERALEAMVDMLPELIVSDIMMPGLDGYAMVEAIRGDPRTDLIPIVFLTARDTRKDRIRGLYAGIDAYLIKPVEMDELVAVIENILRRLSHTHKRVARLPTPGQSQRGATSAASSALTKGEERIAGLVAQGLSNKDIASQLGLSPRTVEMHLSNILAKKNLSNRVELALLITRERANRDRTG